MYVVLPVYLILPWTYYHAILDYNNSISVAFIIHDSNTRHALALQFSRLKWPNENYNRKSSSHFITLPLVVLAVGQSSGLAAPICKQWRVENHFVVKKFSWVSINHGIFLTQNFLKTKYLENNFFILQYMQVTCSILWNMFQWHKWALNDEKVIYNILT